MDTLIIERVPGDLYRVSYNGLTRTVPAWRIESAIKRMVAQYHASFGGGM